MADLQKTSVSIDQMGGSIIGGSPKMIYTVFLIGLCKSLFESMSPASYKAIDYKTAALIAYCPNKTKRKELWEMYSKLKKENKDKGDEGAIITACVYTIGELMSYLNVVLEFEECSTGMIL